MSAKSPKRKVPRRSATDPIFDVITKHTEATKAYGKACRKSGALRDYAPKWKAAHAVTLAAAKQEKNTLMNVLKRQPTTPAGVAALLDHISLPEFLEKEERIEMRNSVLSGALEADDEYKAAALDFPRRIAATMGVAAEFWGIEMPCNAG